MSSNPLITYAMNHSLAMFTTLIETKPNLVNTTDRFDGLTPLHWACYEGDLKMVELLIQHSANVNKVGGGGGRGPGYQCTPFHAIMRAQFIYHQKHDISNVIVAISKMLLASGAAIDARSGHGNTPFKDLVWNDRIGVGDKVVVARLLVANHADINAATCLGGSTSLLDLAVEYQERFGDSSELIDYLKSIGVKRTAPPRAAPSARFGL
jgi:hypothetical protein